MLCEYASSGDECDSENESPPKAKYSKLEECSRSGAVERNDVRKHVLEVPSVVLSMFSDRSDPFAWEDDSVQHEGRIRTFSHEPGVWASYAFISGSDQEDLEHLISSLCKDYDFLKPNDKNICHVSLSKTVKLRHHWIQPIVDALKGKIASFYNFTIFLGSLEVYTNQEKTRTFLSLKVHKGTEQLKKIVAEVDGCLKEYDLPLFYDDPSFHMSLAWCETKHESELQEALQDLQFKLEIFARRHPHCRSLSVTSIWFRSGNKLFELPLLRK